MRPELQERKSGYKANWGRVRRSRAEQAGTSRDKEALRPANRERGLGGDWHGRWSARSAARLRSPRGGGSLSSYTLGRPRAARAQDQTSKAHPGRGPGNEAPPPGLRPSSHPEEARPAAPSELAALSRRAPADASTPARRPPAHPDALQHPDPLLLVHPEGRPSALAALGDAHGGRGLRCAGVYGPGATCQQGRVLLAEARGSANRGAGRAALWGL